MLKSPKVFGIGLQKTGTSSLGEALTLFGYTVCRANFAEQTLRKLGKELGPEHRDQSSCELFFEKVILPLTKDYDAFQDVPWCFYYRELEKHFPDSRFILTLRDPQSWYRSMKSYDRTYNTTRAQRVLAWNYGEGNPIQNRELYLERFREHTEGVLKFFHKRPQKLLVLRMEERDKMRKLAEFLGEPLPSRRYPHVNIGKKNRIMNRLDDVRNLVRRSKERLIQN